MDARTTWPALLSALIRGDSLTADESEWAMNEIMEGAATPSQIAGFGVALRIKGTSVAEMTGLARSMLAHATPISLPGRLTDLVGTGGDGARTVNVSTMGAIVAAAAGARVVKHGNRAASSACGAADVLEALGVVIDLPPDRDRRLAAEVGIAFLLRAAVPPGAAVRRARRAASSACPPCSTSSARWPTRPGPRRRRSGCSTRGWARSWPACWPGAAARPWCSAARTASTS